MEQNFLELKQLICNRISEVRKEYNSTLLLYKKIDKLAWTSLEYYGWYHSGKNYDKIGRMNASSEERDNGIRYQYEKIKIGKELKKLKFKLKDLNRLIDSPDKISILYYKGLIQLLVKSNSLLQIDSINNYWDSFKTEIIRKYQ